MLFDFDGTIIDSEPIALRCLEEYARRLDFALTEEILRIVTGSSYIDLFRCISSLYPHLGDYELLLRNYLATLNQALEASARLLPGVVEWVQDCRRRCPLGVVSGSLRDQIISLLNRFHLTKDFTVIVSAEDVPSGKPSPECYLCAARRFGYRPSEFVVFEDSTLGVLSARGAGMFTVGVAAGNRGAQDLSAASCVITSFPESRLDDVLSAYSNPDNVTQLP